MITRLYALGSNSSGQLGIGHCEDVDVPTPCHFILSSSSNISGEKYCPPTSCDLDSNIRKIVTGGNHTVVLCENGAVYAVGNPEALGGVTDPGSQYAGVDESSFEKLGPYFRRVMWREGTQLLDTFFDISATWSASFFLVAPEIQDGYMVRGERIYVSGRGEKGELGLGTDIVEAKKPTQVALFGLQDYPESTSNAYGEVPWIPGKFAGIWGSMAHTVISSKGGHVYGWGNCRKGQLGNGMKEEKVLWKPNRIAHKDIAWDFKIKEIWTAALGRDFTLLEVQYEKQANRMWDFELLGGNRYLGAKGEDIHAFLDRRSLPTSTQEVPRLEIPFASWSNIYFLDRHTHTVKAIGRNDRGQLPSPELPHLSTMAAGSEHCVGLTLQGRAVTWGWGEHGNCGRKDDETGQGWSVLNVPLTGAEKIAGVGAGCATTFVWTSKR